MRQKVNADQATMTAAHRWADGLQAVTDRIGRRFLRTEPRQRAAAYIQGLFSPLERKNGWQLAEHAGDEAPSGVQHLLGRAGWSADAVRDDLRAYVIEPCGAPQAVLVVDETGFLKKGKKSVGVARQYRGTAGRGEHCPIGVFLVYATAQGRTFLDREWSLPKEWAADETRRQAAGVPTAVRLATQPQLAQRMRRRVLAAGLPLGWLTGDTVYGHDWRVRAWLEEHRINDVLGVSAPYRLFTGQERAWAATVVRRLPEAAWHRCSCGAGSQGERLYDWARLPLRTIEGYRPRWLLARRSLSAPTEIADDVASGPQPTPLDALARVAGTRWAVAESFETAKGAGGLDQDEGRSWQGWYRHLTWALFAQAYLTVLRAPAGAPEPMAPKKTRRERESAKRLKR